MSKNRNISLIKGFTLLAFAVFAAAWFYVNNRYFVLYYHEQVQLFRFDSFYLRSYLGMPGGVCAYLGSFLTQFYFYPVVGALVIAIVLTAVFLLFYSIYRHDDPVGRLLFVPFVPVVLLMASFVDIYFGMSEALGLLFFLITFRGYITIPLPVRYIAGPILVAIVYFVAGGNALLLTVMLLIFELRPAGYAGVPPVLSPSASVAPSLRDSAFQEQKKREQPPAFIIKYPYLLIIGILSVVYPLLAWHLVYTIPFQEAFFALTPANFLYPTPIQIALWLSFPVLYLCWTIVCPRITSWKNTKWKVVVANGVWVVCMTTGCAYSVYDRRAEMLSRMAYDLQHDNWKSVLATGKDFPGSNPLTCYIVNIALAETGQLPYRMFHYRQTGASGLFLDRHLSYTMMWHLGEVYYRLGIISEAEHCAFEALVSFPKEPNAQTLRRLITTNIARRDSVAASKYINYFEHSLFYRQYAQQQRAYLVKAMAEPAFLIPGTPIPCYPNDFFISYPNPDHTLLMLLQSNPAHQKAFEYLMAYWMLEKKVEQVKGGMDRFFENFSYQGIPVHYEEALLVYMAMYKVDNDFYRQYPISRETRDRFGQFIQAYNALSVGKGNMERLRQQFGNTYWYYVYLFEPSSSTKQGEENRY